MPKQKMIICFCLTLFLTAAPCLSFELGNEQAVNGLKEALNVGIKMAVEQTGQKDGFYANPDIKILMPETLKGVDDMIRKFGGGAISDILIEKMNRAAEKAAPQALDIFVNAIKEIKFEDALGLLSGESNAATAYLEKNASDSLKTAFLPIVKQTMEEINAVKTFDDYIGKYKSNPLMQVVNIDINEYVTGKAVDGLFVQVAAQEKKIREDSAARVTDILKDVFGSLGK